MNITTAVRAGTSLNYFCDSRFAFYKIWRLQSGHEEGATGT